MHSRGSIFGRPASTMFVLGFRRKNCNNFLDPLTVVSILMLWDQSPIRSIDRRRLYLNPPQKKVVECLQDPNLPDVPHRMYDTVRSRQTRQAPIQTKQGESVASVKSHPPRLLDKMLEPIEVASHNATMRNFALSGVYWGYKLVAL